MFLTRMVYVRICPGFTVPVGETDLYVPGPVSEVKAPGVLATPRVMGAVSCEVIVATLAMVPKGASPAIKTEYLMFRVAKGGISLTTIGLGKTSRPWTTPSIASLSAT